MSMTDELQRRFETALGSLPSSGPPPVTRLRARLRKRRRRTGAAVLVGCSAVVAAGLTIGLSGAPPSPAGAVVLHTDSGARVTEGQLKADADVMRNRLALLGNTRVSVKIAGSSIVVTGGPVQLADPSSPLTQSPSLLIRPVLCYSGPYAGTAPSGPLPSSCGQYAIKPVTPAPGNGAGSYASPSNQAQTDPALVQYPSTSPVADLANPSSVALLSGSTAPGSTGRYLVGPTELMLSSKVASAQVNRDNYGGWAVTVQLSSSAAAQWSQVAEKYFHLIVAVDLNGEVVTAPVIEPTQATFTPLHGLTLSGGFSKSTANAIAAALQSGPLAIPLHTG